MLPLSAFRRKFPQRIRANWDAFEVDTGSEEAPKEPQSELSLRIAVVVFVGMIVILNIIYIFFAVALAFLFFFLFLVRLLSCEGTDHMIVRSQLELKDEARPG